MRWFAHVNRPSLMGTYPLPAAMWSLNQNTYRKIRPNQNTGADTPNRANPMASRSNFDRGLRADRMPLGMPIRIHTTAAPSASYTVTSSRDMMIGLSAERVLNEKP